MIVKSAYNGSTANNCELAALCISLDYSIGRAVSEGERGSGFFTCFFDGSFEIYKAPRPKWNSIPFWTGRLCQIIFY